MADNPTNPLPDAGTPATDPGSASIESKIQEWAHAIAHAEGFGVPGAAPTTHNNPGDLGPGDTGYPGEFHGGSVISKLPDEETGWAFLTKKLTRIVNGQSTTYNTGMTFADMGKVYAPPNWANWAKNVTDFLGVTPDTRIADWLNQ